MPVFDDLIDKNGAGWANQCSGNRCYHVYGLATFHVTGFRMPGSGWTLNAPCSPPDACFGGYFVAFVLGSSGYTVGGGPNLGTYIVYLSA